MSKYKTDKPYCSKGQCFACENGQCDALSIVPSRYIRGKCPFYKSREQYVEDAIKADKRVKKQAEHLEYKITKYYYEFDYPEWAKKLAFAKGYVL